MRMEPPQNKYCPHCGDSLNGNDNFCGNCGETANPVPNTEEATNSERVSPKFEFPTRFRGKQTGTGAKSCLLMIGLFVLIYITFGTVIGVICAKLGLPRSVEATVMFLASLGVTFLIIWLRQRR